MSLENAIMLNTAAIERLIIALELQQSAGCKGGCLEHSEPVTIDLSSAALEKTRVAIEQATEQIAAKVSAPVQQVSAPEPVVAEPAIVAATPAPVTYDDVSAAITAMFKIDRNRIIETLAKFGVKKGPELHPGEYAAFIEELNK